MSLNGLKRCESQEIKRLKTLDPLSTTRALGCGLWLHLRPPGPPTGISHTKAPTTYSRFTYTLDPVGNPTRIVAPPMWNAACRLAHRAADTARGRSLWAREDAATLGIDGLRARFRVARVPSGPRRIAPRPADLARRRSGRPLPRMAGPAGDRGGLAPSVDDQGPMVRRDGPARGRQLRLRLARARDLPEEPPVVPDRDVAAREQRREQGDPRRGGDRWA